MRKPIDGFSKLSKSEKIDWIVDTYLADSEAASQLIKQYWNADEQLQNLHDEFIENTISNFYLPFGVAPNFLINGKLLALPMAIEESSVVAAASKAAKFWMSRGGFNAKVISTTKNGQVHFKFKGPFIKLKKFFDFIKPKFFEETSDITNKMKSRGGGILDIELIDKTNEIPNYFQLFATFETLDAMGANFINSCLELFAKTLEREAGNYDGFDINERKVEVIMSILSNYTPNCLVRAEVSCKVGELADDSVISVDDFVNKFLIAMKIAEIDPHRAVTHNKGIMNGIDAVVLATGNDFRAIEAGIHAYACKDGKYTSLTHAKVENGIFKFWIDIPLALGTVGGLTSVHPLAKLSLKLLQNPSAKELMEIVAVAGLAQNFGAVKSLITTGIQEGHMKMHLMNILNQLEATSAEKSKLKDFFKDKTVTHKSVEEALLDLRE